MSHLNCLLIIAYESLLLNFAMLRNLIFEGIARYLTDNATANGDTTL